MKKGSELVEEPNFVNKNYIIEVQDVSPDADYTAVFIRCKRNFPHRSVPPIDFSAQDRVEHPKISEDPFSTLASISQVIRIGVAPVQRNQGALLLQIVGHFIGSKVIDFEGFVIGH
jgi:hypothetical protein